MHDKKNDDVFGKAIPQLIHDIRNPLNIIIGFSSILQIDETVNDEVRNYLKKIYHSGMFIEQLLSNIDYFSMDKKDIEVKTFDINSEIDNFFKSKTEIIADKKIIVNIINKNNIEIDFSTELLTKILENLFLFSMKGFKSSKNKEIFVIVKSVNNKLILYYSDSSENITINSDYFTFEEVIKAKRSLCPIFIKKYISLFDGDIKYYYLKNWVEKINDIKINTNHGFIIEMPIIK